MIHPKLRLAAAKFALELATESDLVEASHAALDDAIYADGLAVIATNPRFSLFDPFLHFEAALRDLGHAFTSRDEALRYLRLSYFAPVAEGTETSIMALGRYDQLRDGRPFGPLANFGDSVRPSASSLVSHLDDLEILFAVHEVGRIADLPGNGGREWDERAIQLCRDWCREYGRLYLQPTWRSPTVVALAVGIHAERAFDRLSILADALEEAGCDHPDLLAHCRHASPHTDYCWLVDVLLKNGAT